MNLGIEHIMRNFPRTQQSAYLLRVFDRSCADQNGLSLFVCLSDFVGRCVVFFHNRPVYGIVVILPHHGHMGRHHDNVKTVYLFELFRFCKGGAGHTGKLSVHPEIILQRYCCKSLVFSAYPDPFFSLYSLMQTVRVTAAEH